MRKFLPVTLLLTGGLLALTNTGNAATLSFNPAAQTAPLGSTVQVQIVASDLGTGTTPPAMSAYELTVQFNDNWLDLTAVNFGTGLNLGIAGGSWQDYNYTLGLGQVYLLEISYHTVADLLDQQPDQFVLATLSFNTVAAGSSPLTFADVELVDEKGGSLNYIPTTAEYRITVTSSTVPLPSSLTLLVLGLLSAAVHLSAARRR
jgi:hypothetical protein